MATFYNQASLSFGGNTVNSNTTEAELLAGLTIEKRSVGNTYEAGGSIVYVITLSNLGNGAYNNLVINDNLGAYVPTGGSSAVVPLSYVDGSAVYYLNGIEQPTPTISASNELVISGIDLPASAIATIIYEARANEFASIAQGSQITNTAYVNGGVGIGIITDEATVTVRDEVNLTIAKAVCPAVISDNDEISYTIILQNHGNIPVNATDGLVVRDVFNPVLSDITVLLDGETLGESFYTYNEQTGEFATVNGAIAVPAATYATDPATSEITKTPGVAVLVISGRV